MGSFQVPTTLINAELLESSCGYLLRELQLIWDEIGEEQYDRDKTLRELEQECLEVYKRKVDSANVFRARLHQTLADSEAEFTHLLITLGERFLPSRPKKMTGTLKEQLDLIRPTLSQMQLKKEERWSQFKEVLTQIRRISAEIQGETEESVSAIDVGLLESDLSEKKLDEYRLELQRLHKEKNDRLKKVEEYTNTIRSLSSVLGVDFSDFIANVHPSLVRSGAKQSKNISDSILAKLDASISSLKEEKRLRLEKLIKLGKSLTNLWSLMDTPPGDRQRFAHITNYKMLSDYEASEPGCLALDILSQAEDEVKRLDQLKASKMNDFFQKKQMEVKEICKKSHMEVPFQTEMENIHKLITTGITNPKAIEFMIEQNNLDHQLNYPLAKENFTCLLKGEVDYGDLLSSLDEQISKAKEEALSRKDIMEKVEKWMVSCEEERWLEDYMRDENRYSVSRGAHKNLKRAERARIAVSRIPALVEFLITKIRAWEDERNKMFLYDEVSLCAILEEYKLLRRRKEEDKLRQREKKKMQGQVTANLPASTRNGGYHQLSGKSLNHSLSKGAPPIQKLGNSAIYAREGRLQQENQPQKRKARILGHALHSP